MNNSPFACPARLSSISAMHGAPPPSPAPPPPSTPPTLVVVIGSHRAGEETWDSMLTNLITPLHADLAVLAAFGQPSDLLLRHASHVWRVGEYSDWGELITELVGVNWEANVTLTENLWGGIRTKVGDSSSNVTRTITGSGAILLALRQLVLRFMDAMHGHSYTQVVLTRSDLYHACEHPRIVAADDEVFAPEGEGDHPKCQRFCGYTDRHSIFSFASRHRVLGALEWLVRGAPGLARTSPFLMQHVHHAEAQASTAPLPPRFVNDNLEKVLAAFASVSGMQVHSFNRTMFVAVNYSRTDAARWGSGGARFKSGYPAPLPGNTTVWCKYEREYERAARTCGLPKPRCARPSDNSAWISPAMGGGWIIQKGMGLDFQTVLQTRHNITFEAAVWARYKRLTTEGELPTKDDVIRCNCTRRHDVAGRVALEFVKLPHGAAWRQGDRRLSWAIEMIAAAQRADVLGRYPGSAYLPS